MSVTDAFGEEIQVGDWVSYFSGGKFPTILKGEVVEIRKQVKVRAAQVVEGRYNFRNDNGTHWCVPHRLTKTVETFEVDVTNPDKPLDHNSILRESFFEDLNRDEIEW